MKFILTGKTPMKKKFGYSVPFMLAGLFHSRVDLLKLLKLLKQMTYAEI